MSETLLTKAKTNYNVAESLYKVRSDDEGFLNMIAYHLQQATELLIKWQLEEAGILYPRTHDLSALLDLAREKGTAVILDDWVEDHCDMLTVWEARSRYVLNYRVALSKVQKAMVSVRLSLEMIDKGFKQMDCF